MSKRGYAAFGSVTVRKALLDETESLRVDAGEKLLLLAAQRGILRVRIGDQQHLLAEGEGVLVLPGQRAETRAEHGVELLSIEGPAELASGLERTQGALFLVPRGSALLNPVVAFAGQTLRPQRQSRLSSYYVERLLQEMLQGLLAGNVLAQVAPRGIHNPYRQALAVLESQFSDAGLTSNEVAEAVNLSRRQLEREFSDRGTTIRRELRRLRLDRAQSMLCDRDYDSLSIEQVARHVGLSGASSLARAMAEAGLSSPARLRAASLKNDLGRGSHDPVAKFAA